MTMISITDLSYFDLFLVAGGIWILYQLSRAFRSRVKTTRLNGPPSRSWIFGVSREVYKGDAGALHEEWSKEYGPVYQIPVAFGARQIILMDPKAISHFYSRESFTYVHSHFARQSIAGFVCTENSLCMNGANLRADREGPHICPR